MTDFLPCFYLSQFRFFFLYFLFAVPLCPPFSCLHFSPLLPLLFHVILSFTVFSVSQFLSDTSQTSTFFFTCPVSFSYRCAFIYLFHRIALCNSYICSLPSLVFIIFTKSSPLPFFQASFPSSLHFPFPPSSLTENLKVPVKQNKRKSALSIGYTRRRYWLVGSPSLSLLPFLLPLSPFLTLLLSLGHWGSREGESHSWPAACSPPQLMFISMVTRGSVSQSLFFSRWEPNTV